MSDNNNTPNVVISNDEKLFTLRAQLKNLSIKSNELIINEGDQAEIDKLETERSTINSQIKKLTSEIERERKQAERQQKLDAHLNIVDVFELYLTDLVKYISQLPPVGERNEGQIKHANELNDMVNQTRETLKNELLKSFDNKIVIHAGQGVSGKTVKETLNPESTNGEETKASQIMKLINDGLTDDEIREKGYKDGTVRYQRYMYNKAKKNAQNNA